MCLPRADTQVRPYQAGVPDGHFHAHNHGGTTTVSGNTQMSSRQEGKPGEEVPEAYALSTYQYHLPPERIAQSPHAVRDCSRLLRIDRRSGHLSHHLFKDLAQMLRPSDLLVLNETRVIPAALEARKPTGGRVDLLVLQPAGEKSSVEAGRRAIRACLVRSSKPLKPGGAIALSSGPILTTGRVLAPGRVMVNFPVPEQELLDFLGLHGRTPLPPYIKDDDRHDETDRVRYQTVYARAAGSVAAPTAGLHFTESLLSEIESCGVETARILLHVGPGTFIPVREHDVRRHRMESEMYEISAAVAEQLARGQRDGRRIVAVGTTTVRALESAALPAGGFRAGAHSTDLFILPGHMFKAVGGLITNFHLPGSTLLMLVCAFGGITPLLDAYRVAVGEGYRFYSYGDASIILEE